VCVYIYIKRARERDPQPQVLFSTAHALQDLNKVAHAFQDPMTFEHIVLMDIYICDNSDEVRFNSHNLTTSKEHFSKWEANKIERKSS
jgi:hypothetical protein